MKKVKYPSWDIQYFNKKWELIKTELDNIIIDYTTTPKTVIYKR